VGSSEGWLRWGTSEGGLGGLGLAGGPILGGRMGGLGLAGGANPVLALGGVTLNPGGVTLNLVGVTLNLVGCDP